MWCIGMVTSAKRLKEADMMERLCYTYRYKVWCSEYVRKYASRGCPICIAIDRSMRKCMAEQEAHMQAAAVLASMEDRI